MGKEIYFYTTISQFLFQIEREKKLEYFLNKNWNFYNELTLKNVTPPSFPII